MSQHTEQIETILGKAVRIKGAAGRGISQVGERYELGRLPALKWEPNPYQKMVMDALDEQPPGIFN